MVIEFARNVCGLANANSTEFDQAAADRVIYKLRELKGVDELGGTMRLGAYPCNLAEGQLRARGLRHGSKSASATATATNSTVNTRIF